MRITCLMENTAGAAGCVPAHGLSLFIETPEHRLLMDAGPSAQTVDNARALGVDLASVDIAVLSHGHYDHADGLAAFAAANTRAKIYLRQGSAGDYWSESGGTPHYIGMSDAARGLERLVFVDGTLRLDEGLWLFGDVSGRRLWPQGNAHLLRRVDGELLRDDFAHEQCLAVASGGRRALFSGCAHSGILNILDRYKKLFGGCPDAVISGFHMMQPAPYTPEQRETILETARTLADLPCAFYTCHCTGIEAYEIMRGMMGDQLRYLRCGDRVDV